MCFFSLIFTKCKCFSFFLFSFRVNRSEISRDTLPGAHAGGLPLFTQLHGLASRRMTEVVTRGPSLGTRVLEVEVEEREADEDELAAQDGIQRLHRVEVQPALTRVVFTQPAGFLWLVWRGGAIQLHMLWRLCSVCTRCQKSMKNWHIYLSARYQKVSYITW